MSRAARLLALAAGLVLHPVVQPLLRSTTSDGYRAETTSPLWFALLATVCAAVLTRQRDSATPPARPRRTRVVPWPWRSSWACC